MRKTIVPHIIAMALLCCEIVSACPCTPLEEYGGASPFDDSASRVFWGEFQLWGNKNDLASERSLENKLNPGEDLNKVDPDHYTNGLIGVHGDLQPAPQIRMHSSRLWTPPRVLAKITIGKVFRARGPGARCQLWLIMFDKSKFEPCRDVSVPYLGGGYGPRRIGGDYILSAFAFNSKEYSPDCDECPNPPIGVTFKSKRQVMGHIDLYTKQPPYKTSDCLDALDALEAFIPIPGGAMGLLKQFLGRIARSKAEEVLLDTTADIAEKTLSEIGKNIDWPNYPPSRDENMSEVWVRGEVQTHKEHDGLIGFDYQRYTLAVASTKGHETAAGVRGRIAYHYSGNLLKNIRSQTQTSGREGQWSAFTNDDAAAGVKPEMDGKSPESFGKLEGKECWTDEESDAASFNRYAQTFDTTALGFFYDISPRTYGEVMFRIKATPLTDANAMCDCKQQGTSRVLAIDLPLLAATTPPADDRMSTDCREQNSRESQEEKTEAAVAKGHEKEHGQTEQPPTWGRTIGVALPPDAVRFAFSAPGFEEATVMKEAPDGSWQKAGTVKIEEEGYGKIDLTKIGTSALLMAGSTILFSLVRDESGTSPALPDAPKHGIATPEFTPVHSHNEDGKAITNLAVASKDLTLDGIMMSDITTTNQKTGIINQTGRPLYAIEKADGSVVAFQQVETFGDDLGSKEVQVESPKGTFFTKTCSYDFGVRSLEAMTTNVAHFQIFQRGLPPHTSITVKIKAPPPGVITSAPFSLSPIGPGLYQGHTTAGVLDTDGIIKVDVTGVPPGKYTIGVLITPQTEKIE